MKNKVIYVLFIAATIVYSCKKLYNPTIISTNLNYLVVEGFINTGTDSTIIKLSRTVVVTNKTPTVAESKATVSVEDAQGILTFNLPETAIKGTYAITALNLDNTKQYRLRIKTSNGQTYLSDLIEPKITRPIDSVGYTIGPNGIDLYANTHDASNQSRYYKYTYRETWQFTARYFSPYIFSATDTTLHIRTPDQQIYRCFNSDTSAHTILYSTAALSQDVAYHVPLTSIGVSDEKVGVKYSILVRQQALTKSAYEFYEGLKKNTEDLGSIFDAQPSQLVGNIHNVANAAEPVVGYISAGTTQTKRIYILKKDLPANFFYLIRDCDMDTAVFYPSHNITRPPDPNLRVPPPLVYVEEVLYPNVGGKLYNSEPNFLALEPRYNSRGDIIYFLFTDRICADCTLRGVTKQPAFWK